MSACERRRRGAAGGDDRRVDPNAEILRPDGRTLCWGATDASFSCPVDSDGTYTILVSDDTGLNTGRYEIWNPPVITSGTISGGK